MLFEGSVKGAQRRMRRGQDKRPLCTTVLSVEGSAKGARRGMRRTCFSPIIAHSD